MKKRIIAAMLSAITICMLYSGNVKAVNGNLYPATMVVTETDVTNDIVVMEDTNGNVWEMDDVEDWMVDDVVSLIMSDNGTETIYDDIIISARYSGSVEDFVK